MQGIHPDTCTHHIYIEKGSHLVQQPQHRLNLALRDIVKEELQKLLNVGFICPIWIIGGYLLWFLFQRKMVSGIFLLIIKL